MKRRTLLSAVAALAFIAATHGARAEDTTLTVVTAGDQNMVDYVKDYLGPIFEKTHPGVKVKSVGTGPGDAGSQQIYEKLSAEKDKPIWDIDVAVIHQKASAQMKGEGMLMAYTKDVETEKYVTNPMTTNGTSRLTIIQNVGVWNMLSGTPLNTVPMFGNQQSTT